MKVISLFALVFIARISFACELNSSLQYISLSGPMSVLLKELSLLNDKSLRAISRITPITPREYKGEFIDGGIFISKKKMNEFKDAIVFYDESMDMSKNLNAMGFKTIEIKTKKRDPFKVYEELIPKLKPYLNNCKKNISLLDLKIEKIKKYLLERRPFNTPVIFFLGKIKGDRKPQLVMANDLFVKFWVKHNKLKTYPSELSYVPWSSRLLAELGDVQMVGIGESEKFESEELKNGQMNFTGSGALTPGISQIYFMKEMSYKIN